ncbi:MAG: hypothetical protein WKG07_19045 [Hymenobacter sp.]
MTSAAGTFQLAAVAAGSHELRITFLGYEPLARPLQGAAAAQQLDARLQPGGVLTGEALITASRASDRTATVYTNLSTRGPQQAQLRPGPALPARLDALGSRGRSDAGAGRGLHRYPHSGHRAARASTPPSTGCR